MVFTATTQGIQVSVRTRYQRDYSQPKDAHYVFSYHITIVNKSDFTVRLLRRHWFIFDSIGLVSEVEGEGVIGQQPVLSPGQSHQYASGCHLQSELGKMKGVYQMERLMDQSLFDVIVPDFTMITPYKLN